MFSDAEKRELQALAKSQQVREEFDGIRRSGLRAAQRIPIDDVLSFLTFMSKLAVVPPSQRPIPVYTNIRL